MKTQIRKNVFETNSSSIHAIAICTNEEYQAWKRGDLCMNRDIYECTNGWYAGAYDYDELFTDMDEMMCGVDSMAQEEYEEQFYDNPYVIPWGELSEEKKRHFKEEILLRQKDYISYNMWAEDICEGFDTFYAERSMSDGDTVVCFGHYGRD